MEDFEEALRLFDTYQRTGISQDLRGALDILDDIIESQSVVSKKAENLKNTISKYIAGQINLLKTKCNIGEFSKDLNKSSAEESLQKFISGVYASATEADANRFVDLFMISLEYLEK